MKKIILIVIAIIIQLSAQTNITVPSLNLKSVLDSTDLFLISQTDTNYYKVSFDNLVDQIEDSLGKSNINYINKSQTITGWKTFAGGLTSTNTTNLNGPLTLGNTTTVNGAITFNSRPSFYGALFNSASYGTVRFEDSTYFYNGFSTFYNNPVVFDGNSNITVYGTQDMIAGSRLKIALRSYPQTYRALGYVGSDGGSYLAFDYGSTGGQTDTIPGFRYLRSNYAGLSSNNTFNGNNTFYGTNTYWNNVTFGEPVVFSKRITLNKELISKVDSVAYGAEDVTIDITTKSPYVVIYGYQDAPNVTSISGYHGQVVTFLIHPSTYTTVNFTNNSIIKLTGSTNVQLTPGSTITFMNFRDKWYEISRSVK
jgi:hypothetical protein